jgi:hypothetical protein
VCDIEILSEAALIKETHFSSTHFLHFHKNSYPLSSALIDCPRSVFLSTKSLIKVVCKDGLKSIEVKNYNFIKFDKDNINFIFDPEQIQQHIIRP